MGLSYQSCLHPPSTVLLLGPSPPQKQATRARMWDPSASLRLNWHWLENSSFPLFIKPPISQLVLHKPVCEAPHRLAQCHLQTPGRSVVFSLTQMFLFQSSGSHGVARFRNPVIKMPVDKPGSQWRGEWVQCLLPLTT